jgi:uncharacterized protein YcbX
MAGERIGTPIGKVAQIWRYPIKSMMGERMTGATITDKGLLGDRGWAARDEVRGGIRGAKKIGALMTLAAAYQTEPRPEAPLPEVDITLPDGRTVATTDDDVDKVVSDALGHQVTLHSLHPASDVEHYRRGPGDFDDPMAELRAIFGRTDDEPLPTLEGFGNELIGELMQYESPPGTYFDAFPLLLVTDATLRTLESLAPDAAFDVRRFRPNVFVALDGEPEGFPEQSWIGRRIVVGGVELDVHAACPRCVMVTRGFADLPEDRSVLRTIVREADQNVGVYATVAQPGRVAENDLVSFAS